MSKKEQHNGEQKQFWDLIERFHEFYFELSANGEFVYINKKMQDLIGYKHTELLGKRYTDFVANFHKEEAIETFKNYYDNNLDDKTFHFLHDFLKKDKEYVLLEINGLPVYKDNKLYSLRVLARDVTETKLQQIDLYVKNAAMDKAMTAIIITDLKHVVYYANEAAYKMFGYKEKNSMNNLNAYALWKNGNLEYKKYKKKLASKGEYKRSFLASRQDGSNFNAQIYASAITDKTNQVICFMKSINNISDEVKAKNKIRKQKNRLDDVLDASDQGYWDYDLTNDIMYFSPTWYSLLGYKDKEFPSSLQAFYGLIHPDEVDGVKQSIDAYVEKTLNNEKRSYGDEIRMRCKDGSYKWIMTKGKGVECKNGQPIRFVGTHTDITDRKKYEQEILQKNKELEFFVHSASHDLQSPLVTLSGFSNIILKQHKDNCTQSSVCPSYNIVSSSAEEIRKATHHLSETISKLLQLSRMGKLHKNRQIIDVGQTINRIIEMNQESIKDADAEIIVINSLEANVQKETFVSIIQNLLQNALCYARVGEKKLKIKIMFSKRTDNSLLIMFSDNGPGIPEGMQTSIFEPFKRLTKKGNGLGLSIVKKGAEEIHNGSACVENNIDGGATFYISLKDCFNNPNENQLL